MIRSIYCCITCIIYVNINTFSSSTEYGNSGVITSPNWPSPYSYSSFAYDSYSTRECEWDIKRNSDELIQLNFMDVDISDSFYPSSCSTPYLEVQGIYFHLFFLHIYLGYLFCKTLFYIQALGQLTCFLLYRKYQATNLYT